MATAVQAPERLVILEPVSWQTYERPLEEQQGRGGTRFTYDGGMLQIRLAQPGLPVAQQRRCHALPARQPNPQEHDVAAACARVDAERGGAERIRVDCHSERSEESPLGWTRC